MRDVTGFRVSNAIIVLVVLVAAGIAAWQLARVVSNAQAISKKATTISQNGRGINIATDSVIQLNRTNRTAKSILRSAKPLQPKLDRIVGEARGIDGLATSIDTSAAEIDSTADTINGSAHQINDTAGVINATAGDINSTAGAINATAGDILSTAGDINNTAGEINNTAGQIDSIAGGINSDASGILREAIQIDRDVFLINYYLNGSLDVAGLIRGDTANIVRLAVNAHDTASCIDRKVDNGDRHCVGRSPGSGARTGGDGSAPLGRRGGPAPMGEG